MLVNCSQNGQLGLYQNQCAFQNIHSLFTGGAHSRLLAYIASPTSPPYVGKQLTCSSVPHTATDKTSCLRYCSTDGKLRILVKAQPSTPSTWPLSPTIQLQDLGLPNEFLSVSCIHYDILGVLYTIKLLSDVTE